MDRLDPNNPLAPKGDPVLTRLADQVDWYDRKSQTNQRAFKVLKILSIVAAACIPALASVTLAAPVTAGLGVLLVVIEGLQQLNQYHTNWLMYRSTCEQLRREKHLYLASAGPYGDDTTRRALLAERVEAIVSQEHTAWVQSQEQTAKTKPGDKP